MLKKAASGVLAVLTRGAHASYVSANAAKSGKSVSPKAAQGQPQVWRAAPAKPGNAAGGPSIRLRTGLFQHSHEWLMMPEGAAEDAAATKF